MAWKVPENEFDALCEAFNVKPVKPNEYREWNPTMSPQQADISLSRSSFYTTSRTKKVTKKNIFGKEKEVEIENREFITSARVIESLVIRIIDLENEIKSLKGRAIELEEHDEAYIILKYKEPKEE